MRSENDYYCADSIVITEFALRPVYRGLSLNINILLQLKFKCFTVEVTTSPSPYHIMRTQYGLYHFHCNDILLRSFCTYLMLYKCLRTWSSSSKISESMSTKRNGAIWAKTSLTNDDTEVRDEERHCRCANPRHF